jgi:hypothetical protein
MIDFAYSPIRKYPIDLFARLSYQFMFSRMSVESLGGFKGYWTAEEAATKKVSVGNLALTIGARFTISSLKLPKKQVSP